MRKGWKVLGRALFVWTFVLRALPALATPQILRLDGMLYDSSGIPLSGVTSAMQVSAFSAATGGSVLWTSNSYNVVPTKGRFTVNLDTAANGGLGSQIASLGGSGSLWLEISHNSTPVRPRMKSRGTMFAISASSADSLLGVTVAMPALLNGATANVQTQINTLIGNLAGKQGVISQSALNGAGAISISNAPGIIGATAATISVTTATATQNGILLGSEWAGFTAASALANSAVQRAGDTMTGALRATALTSTGAVTAATTLSAATVNVSGLTGSQLVFTNAGKNLVSSTSGVSDTNLGYLAGVTNPMASLLNGVTVSAAGLNGLGGVATALTGVTGTVLGGYLNGLTANVQSQINTLASSIGSGGSSATTNGGGNPFGGTRADCTTNNGGNAGNGGATLVTAVAMPNFCIENTARSTATQTTAVSTCSGLGGNWGLCRQEEVIAACWIGYYGSTTNATSQNITQNYQWTVDLYNATNAMIVGSVGCTYQQNAYALTASLTYRCCLR